MNERKHEKFIELGWGALHTGWNSSSFSYTQVQINNQCLESWPGDMWLEVLWALSLWPPPLDGKRGYCLPRSQATVSLERLNFPTLPLPRQQARSGETQRSWKVLCPPLLQTAHKSQVNGMSLPMATPVPSNSFSHPSLLENNIGNTHQF